MLRIVHVHCVNAEVIVNVHVFVVVLYTTCTHASFTAV